MRKQTRKIVSLALAGGLILGMAPVRKVKAEGELTQLPAPARVEWITESDESTQLYPGMVLHSRIPEGNGEYRYYYYDEDGTELATDENHFDVTNTADLADYWGAFDGKLEPLGSGTYVIGVQALGDGETTADSEITKSGPWTYEKPENALPAPENAHWSENEAGEPVLSFDPPADDGSIWGLSVQWYYSPPGTDETSRDKIGTSSTSIGDGEDIFSGQFRHTGIDWRINKYGAGNYYFQLRWLSKDITQSFHSGWSELSDAYPVQDIAAEITDQVGRLTQSLTENSTPEDIQAAIDGVKALDTADLKTAMSADHESQGVVEQISRLEELSKVETRIAVAEEDGVQVDPAKVSVVGAALNAREDAASITLNIGKPAQEAVIPGAYKNTIQLDFTLDNVAEEAGTGKLDVPVRLTLPIPGNIKKENLHILHFHNSTQDYEEIKSPYTFTENGVDYVTFVVDRFSTFAFVEEGTEETAPSPVPTPAPVPSATPAPNPPASGGGSSHRPASRPQNTPEPSPSPTPTPSPSPTEPPAPIVARASYRDVPAGSWYAGAVAFVTERGLFQGMNGGNFDPEREMSRAMVLTVLGRMDGADVSGSGPEWYKNAVTWAVKGGISDGSAPTAPVSRQELAVLLYRHAGTPAGGRALTAPDSGEVAPWAREAMAWAVETGLLEGYEDGRLLPAAAATRAQVAAIFQRYLEWCG